MSEGSTPMEKSLSKQELEDKLEKTQVMLDTYQAAMLNKMLAGTNYRLDIFENVRK